MYKLFAKVILNRIAKNLDEQQPPDQAGFRSNFSTIDNLHTIKQILQKYQEYNKSIFIAFIDYVKAFDLLEHEYIWESLIEQGVDLIYIRILKNIYDNSTAAIFIETIGPFFNTKRGVKQGDPLSPKLFNAVLERIFQKIDIETLGININGKTLTSIRFADDVAVFSETENGLQEMLDQINEESKKAGLQINIEKTKIISNRNLNMDIGLENSTIEKVEEFTYLGQLISMEECQTKEINARITKAWKSYWTLKDILKSNISMKQKTKIINTCILPVLTYGSQNWALTKQQTQKLRTCQRSIERKLLGIKLKDKIKNVEIRKKTKLKDVVATTNILKWSWAGHIARIKDERWAKITTEWIPRDGKRSRGRQRKRWEDSLIEEAGPFWQRRAQDRTEWKLMGEAYAQKWAYSL